MLLIKSIGSNKILLKYIRNRFIKYETDLLNMKHNHIYNITHVLKIGNLEHFHKNKASQMQMKTQHK